MQGQRQREKRPYIRRVEFVFYHERAIRDAVFEAREDTVTPEVYNNSGLPDPTLREVIRRLTPVDEVLVSGEYLKYPERWLDVVDKTYAWCKNQQGCHYEIARRRYRGEHYLKSCRELHISQNSYSSLLEKIRTYAALQAAQLNLIFVE